MRMTARTRLTAMFAALFLVLAVVLVSTAYLLVAHATTPEVRAEDRAEILAELLLDAGVEMPTLPRESLEALVDEGGDGALAEVLKGIEAEARQGVLDDLLVWSIAAYALAAAVAVPLAYWLAGRVLRPVDEISVAAQALSDRTLDVRLPDARPDDEFGRLKIAFNGMLDRLQTSFQGRQRFAADASHELRTPLVVMRASADNVLSSSRPSAQARGLAAQVLAQVDRSDSLMDSLIALARADDVPYTRERVDLADVVVTVVADMADRATELGVEVDLSVSDAPVSGDVVLLERMVANLVDNALRYHDRDAPWLRCAVRTEDARVVLEVESSGPEVSQGEVDRWCERFSRGTAQGGDGGHGLGLPLVLRIADAHGGSMSASPRLAGGIAVRVELLALA